MAESKLNIVIITASTREGRIGGTVGEWFVSEAEKREDITVDSIDLAEIELPATLSSARNPAVDEYKKRIDAADGFVLVTPEYNHGYPASLKQAIDLAGAEWRTKPVAFVSYGGVGGGLRSVEQLRQVFAELHAMTVRNVVSFHMVHDLFGDDGLPDDAEDAGAAAQKMIDQLVWWSSALRDGRERREYAA